MRSTAASTRLRTLSSKVCTFNVINASSGITFSFVPACSTQLSLQPNPLARPPGRRSFAAALRSRRQLPICQPAWLVEQDALSEAAHLSSSLFSMRESTTKEGFCSYDVDHRYFFFRLAGDSCDLSMHVGVSNLEAVTRSYLFQLCLGQAICPCQIERARFTASHAFSEKDAITNCLRQRRGRL
jgi:hypothetical protein